MKKVLINLFAVVALALSMSSCGYNSMVEKQETVTKSWAQVEAQYQRRLDLIGNIVKTVQQAGKYESSTLEAVIQARNTAAGVKIDPSKLSQEEINKYAAAQQNAYKSISVVVEAYPELKATEGYRDLTVELEGTENRIAVARTRFNEAVGDYNTYIRKFPNNFTAGWFDFEPKGYFQAAEGADKAPELKFE